MAATSCSALGYTRYALTQAVWKAIEWALKPRCANRLRICCRRASRLPCSISCSPGRAGGQPARKTRAPISGKMYRVAEMLKQSSVEGLYRSIVAENWPSGKRSVGAATADF